MASLVELTVQLVAAQASTSPMSTDDMLENLSKVHKRLEQLERGEEVSPAPQEEEAPPQISFKEAFKKNEVVCMVCGKGGFRTLTRHLATAHGLKPGGYRKQFGIPSSQSLSAKAYSEHRRQMAVERGLADNLAKARAARTAKMEQKAPAPGRGKTAGSAKAATATPASPAAAPKPGRATKQSRPAGKK